MCMCVCVCANMCSQEHAAAAHSEQSHIKAIIISPPAIITTSDSPLSAKLIFPLVPCVRPSSLTSFPPVITILTNAFVPVFFSSFLFPLFPLRLTIHGKADFLLQFSFIAGFLWGCYAVLRCVYPEPKKYPPDTLLIHRHGQSRKQEQKKKKKKQK